MKILTIVGARPQFVKAATVSRAISVHNSKRQNPSINEVIVHTGQHYDEKMSNIFFEEMHIPEPDYHLGIGGTTHGQMTGQMLEKIETIIVQEQPNLVMVYGDTNSTLAGALAAVKLQIKVAHIEAGLRSFNMRMPEEINRVLTDHISHWLFCPTTTAVKNLHQENILNIRGVQVANVGDVMYDASIYYRKIAKPTVPIRSLINQLDDKFYLATIHRAENTDDPVKLGNIMSALQKISQTKAVVLPLHPRTRQQLEIHSYGSQFHIIEPVGYFDMIFLLSNCSGVFTDSGGLQKEAYFFKKPCITLREETEWIELIHHQVNTLVGADIEKILRAEKNINMMTYERDYSNFLYGDGMASEKIIEILTKH